MSAARGTIAAVMLAMLVATGRAADEPTAAVVLSGHTNAVSAVAWSTDGQTVATAGDDRSIRLWEPATGRQTGLLPNIARDGYGSPVVAFTADLQLAAVNYWGEITLRRVADGRSQSTLDPILDRGQQSAFRPDVFAMAFSPDGKRLATAGSVAAVGGRHGLPGGRVLVWDVATGRIVHRLDGLSTAASCVAWSADGRRFAAGTNGAGGELPEPGEVRVWDAATGEQLHRLPVQSEVRPGEWASAADVAFSPDGNQIAVPITAGSRGTPAGLLIDSRGASVRIWNVTTGRFTQPVHRLPASITRVAFSPDGQSLATAGQDHVVRVHALDTGAERAAFTCPARITVAVFSPDGQSLAAGSQDGTVRVWRLSEAR